MIILFLYWVGAMFTYGFLHRDPPGWSTAIACATWPLTLGVVARDALFDDSEEYDNTDSREEGRRSPGCREGQEAEGSHEG